jgi:hypothetical protein
VNSWIQSLTIFSYFFEVSREAEVKAFQKYPELGAWLWRVPEPKDGPLGWLNPGLGVGSKKEIQKNKQNLSSRF